MTTEKRVIKKYPNRRLYDTATSSYITLEDVKQLVLDHIDIQVTDAKTQEDITRSVLLQIILEEESSGAPLFTYDVLTQLIRFYGNAMQGLMGGYLEKNLELFSQMQSKLQDQTRQMMGDNPLTQGPNLWAEYMKFQGPAVQNMMTNYLEQSTNMFVEMQSQMQERTKQIFTGFPFAGYGGESPADGESVPPSGKPAKK
ncbi:MAG: polyhydroxyalkanoate synthesis repressor PhaR [Laribacter sp.]|nr:polyhydroxyalkanoate synthesis repressor PhaR [Laribacter sp.]MBP9528827.1 polyhydroxyalkanoate synthesis repressor PhaR [Laribacter sp.]